MIRIAVVGAGGVGGYFGARLVAAGVDLTFIARGAHLETMRRQGLHVELDIGTLHRIAGAGENRDLAGGQGQGSGCQAQHVSGDHRRMGKRSNAQEQAQLSGPHHLVNQPGRPRKEKAKGY